MVISDEKHKRDENIRLDSCVWKIYLYIDNKAKLKNQKQWKLAGWKRGNTVKVLHLYIK